MCTSSSFHATAGLYSSMSRHITHTWCTRTGVFWRKRIDEQNDKTQCSNKGVIDGTTRIPCFRKKDLKEWKVAAPTELKPWKSRKLWRNRLTGSPSTTFPSLFLTTLIMKAWKVMINTGPCSIIFPETIWSKLIDELASQHVNTRGNT